MIEHAVLNRWTNAVQFTAQIDCTPDAPLSVKLGLAVLWGVKNRASLDGANLVRARLDGANLDGANLDGANLDGANLDGASLVRASLVRARLDGASLDGASLVRARLDGASLDGANLDGASLDGANLDGASLVRARLDGARLDGANLDGCKGADMDSGRIPIQIQGLRWPVTITDSQMRIGCQVHLFSAWRDFSAAEIRLMDRDAPAFWSAHKTTLFALIEASGRVVDSVTQEG